MPDATIAKGFCIAVNTVRLCVDKYLEGGVQRALFDEYRKGRPVEINSDAIAWMISIACQHPVDLGYSQELWTLKNLHKPIQAHAEEAGFQRLKTVTKARIQQILVQQDIKPFKIKDYCEKRDLILMQKYITSSLSISRLKCSLMKPGKSLSQRINP